MKVDKVVVSNISIYVYPIALPHKCIYSQCIVLDGLQRD